MAKVVSGQEFNIDQVLDSIINGVIITDSNGDIIHCNRSFLKMLKYNNPEEVFNKNAAEFFTHSEVFKISDVNNIIKKSGDDLGCFSLRCKDGSLIKTEINSSTLENDNGERFGWIISANDLTFLENIKDDLQKKSAELEKLEKQKDDFIWQLGHDLKTPLSPITSLLPIIERNISDPKQKEMIKRVVNNANILKNEVNKILEAAQIKAFGTSTEFENIGLYNIISSVISEKNEDLHQKNIIVDNEISLDILVNAEKAGLKKVFNQLISNSIEYSKEGSCITIFADYDVDFVRVEYKDNGSGLSKENLDHIFDEFYKTDESRHNLKTSGLGLSIVKQIIEKNGGEIFAQSLGEGMDLTFYISIKKGVLN